MFFMPTHRFILAGFGLVALLCGLAFFVIQASSALATEPHMPDGARSPAEWSDAVQKRYAELDNMQVFFEQKLTHGESGITEERQGEIHFRKPFLVRWITRPPAEEILVVTDKVIWQYLPDEELAYKFPLEAMDEKNAFLRVLFGMSSLNSSFAITVLSEQDDQDELDGGDEYDAPTGAGEPDKKAEAGESVGQDVSGESADSGDLVALQLDPYEPTTSLLQAIIWLEPESATLRRLRITDFYGNVSEMNVTSLELNVKIPDATFEFSPPPNTEIEDQTK